MKKIHSLSKVVQERHEQGLGVERISSDGTDELMWDQQALEHPDVNAAGQARILGLLAANKDDSTQE
ncbi:hypothetical protein [Deinococcus roseus]|uniref:Uncharacterized protein n=1 Tax=Deinococcus roseus TaxID=392414 RepID=A0ABQ2DHM9_9DEIO|nr:hypothetical protein [Deinococcus roseus]GGJ56899.1 hypothetical protein GCM10008938_48860 [Deinococcus roseus]